MNIIDNALDRPSHIFNFYMIFGKFTSAVIKNSSHTILIPRFVIVPVSFTSNTSASLSYSPNLSGKLNCLVVICHCTHYEFH